MSAKSVFLYEDSVADTLDLMACINRVCDWHMAENAEDFRRCFNIAHEILMRYNLTTKTE